MPTLTRAEVIRETQRAERLAIHVLMAEPLDMELLEEVRAALIELKAAELPIKEAIAEIVNTHVEQYGEPWAQDPDQKWLPPKSFGADIMQSKVAAYGREGAIEVAVTLDLDAAEQRVPNFDLTTA